MEKTIYVEALQERYKIDLKNANKAQRNRSYSQASNCCGVELKQDKRCSSCGEISPFKTDRKLVKIGKDKHLIDAKSLDAVQEILEASEEIVVKTFLSEQTADAIDRYDGLVYAFPVKKADKQYAELVALLKGRVAIGKTVFGGNEYETLITVGNDGVIRVRKLVEERQRYEYDFEAVKEMLDKVVVDAEVLAVAEKIIRKNTVDNYDFSKFADSRAEFEEKVIEDYVLNGKLPSVSPKVELEDKQRVERLERLKALESA